MLYVKLDKPFLFKQLIPGVGQTKQHAEKMRRRTEWPQDLVAGISLNSKATGNETGNQITCASAFVLANYCEEYREHTASI